MGRGFYQQDENSLLLLIRYPGEQPRFFNHLESDNLRLETDLKGRLLALEFSLPREQWPAQEVGSTFVSNSKRELPPEADLRFLDFRIPLPSILCETNQDKSTLSLKFDHDQSASGVKDANTIQIATQLYATVSNDTLRQLTITQIGNDRGGKAVDRWREEMLLASRTKE